MSRSSASSLHRLLIGLYDLLWHPARLVLYNRTRTRYRWNDRLVLSDIQGPHDLWIQASSGGEATLGVELFRTFQEILENQPPPPTTGETRRLRILLTSGTREGVEILESGIRHHHRTDAIQVSVCCFPLDAPHIMGRAFSRYRPGACVLLETELWPGFLYQASQHAVPVHIVNGRISPRSLGGYLRFGKFFAQHGPQTIYAISEEDCSRYARLFPGASVAPMDNIKFDIMLRNLVPIDSSRNETAITPATPPFVIFGSIHRQEERAALEIARDLLESRPDCCIGIFPKKRARIQPLLNLFTGDGIPTMRKSAARSSLIEGTVIVWDRFGELGETYRYAQGAFIGGSLVDAGGQNFLEPLRFGIRPIIGPHWQDFRWVGKEFFEQSLVRVCGTPSEIAQQLLHDLNSQPLRPQVAHQSKQILRKHSGGSKTVCHSLLRSLS